MNAWLIAGLILAGVGAFCGPVATLLLWQGQQAAIRAAGAKPVIDVYVDPEKQMHIENRGTVDVEGIRIDVITLTLETPDPENLSKIGGIKTYTKPSGAFYDKADVLSPRGRLKLDLTNGNLADYYELGTAPLNAHAIVHSYRVAMRNSVTKQRLVKYVPVCPIKGIPDAFGDQRHVGGGGAYETALKLYKLRDQIRAYQAQVFDDDERSLYQD